MIPALNLIITFHSTSDKRSLKNNSEQYFADENGGPFFPCLCKQEPVTFTTYQSSRNFVCICWHRSSMEGLVSNYKLGLRKTQGWSGWSNEVKKVGTGATFACLFA